VAHVVLNWRAFTLYFKRPVAGTIMALGAIVLGLSAVLSGGEGGGNPMVAVMGGLGQSRIEQLAVLRGQDPQELSARLQQMGYTDAAPDQTVAALSGGDRGAQGAILSAIFAQQ
jgi:hypothetical protein